MTEAQGDSIFVLTLAIIFTIYVGVRTMQILRKQIEDLKAKLEEKAK